RAAGARVRDRTRGANLPRPRAALGVIHTPRPGVSPRESEPPRGEQSGLMFSLSKRIGIDLGTANCVVSDHDRGIVLDEPSVVAIAERDNTVVAVGNEARAMIGRHPGSIQVIRPMRDG